MSPDAAKAEALRQVPPGAKVIRTRCQELDVMGDDRYRCTVEYHDMPATEADAPQAE